MGCEGIGGPKLARGDPKANQEGRVEGLRWAGGLRGLRGPDGAEDRP